MKRLFLDTNIVIDFLLERQEWLNDAVAILSLADAGKIEVYCSALTLATASFFYGKSKDATRSASPEIEWFLRDMPAVSD